MLLPACRVRIRNDRFGIQGNSQLVQKRQELIAAIYASTLNQPDVFDYIVKLDDLLFGVDGDAAGKPGQTDKELVEHIKLTAKIQSEIGRKSPHESKTYQTVIDAVPNPCFVFERDGKQLAANKQGQAKAHLVGRPIDQFLNDTFVLKEIRAYLKSSKNHEMLALPLFDEEAGEHITMLVKKMLGIDPSSEQDGQFLVSMVDFGFDETASETFKSAYGLTDAELQVAILLAKGVKARDIAGLRSVSDQTVRSQIKSIKVKTFTADIPALVRLLCGFSAGILVPNSLLVSPSASTSKLVDDLRHVVLKDGRKLYYVEQGAAAGFPVLHMHNAGYGSELPRTAIEAARDIGLRIIAPYRAGCGDSTKFNSKNTEHYLDQCADDQADLLGKLKLDSAIVAGMGIGSSHAMRFAKRHPERVVKLIGVAKPPVWKDAWALQMPRAQRFTVRIARHFPQLMPIVGTVFASFYDRDLSGNMMRNGLRDSPVDLESLDNPEILNLFSNSSNYVLKQDAAAFVKDVFVSITDMTADALSCQHKFHILHGQMDGVIPISQSEKFIQAVPGSRLQVLPDAGHHIYYTHWQAYLDVLARYAFDVEKAQKPT